MIDYTLILNCKYPNTEWILDGDDYSGLTWLSKTPKPTKAKLDSLWDEVQEQIKNEQNAKIAKKEAALSKLGALGLDIDDLKALGLG